MGIARGGHQLLQGRQAMAKASLICVCTLFSICASATTVTTVNWVNAPLRPGEVGMINGGGFTSAAAISLQSSDGVVTANITAFDVSATALKFDMPTGGLFRAYDLVVGDAPAVPINTPDPWWWQGDAGNASTLGGWIRVFGRGLAPPSNELRPEALEQLIMEATHERRFTDARALLAQLARVFENPTNTTLRLTSQATGETLTILAENCTEYDAWFQLPSSSKPGRYTAAISSGLRTPSFDGWAKLSMFESPSQPELDHISVAPRRR